jgi:hypothetical protein
MPLAITDYFETMQQRDFLRLHQYRVAALSYKGLSLTEQDLVYLRTGEIPNRTINQVSVPFMGLNFQVPGTVQYQGTMQLNFYCDQPQIVRSIFESMSYTAFDDRYSGGQYTVSNQDILTFRTYNNTSPEQQTTVYNLVGIFPTEVGNIAMDTTNNGEAANFNVTIAYQYWEKQLQQVPVNAAPAAT